MKKSKVGNRKHIRKILQIEDNWDAILDLVSTTSFQDLLYIVEKELDKRFNIVESNIVFEDKNYEDLFSNTLERKKFLEKESTYLNEEGILDWVRSSNKTQVVPSPFYSYGKSAIIITPLYDKEIHIGYFLALSRNNRLLFNDIQINNIDRLIKLFTCKFSALFNLLRNDELEKNLAYYENIILDNVNYIDSKLYLESISEKLVQSLNIIKSNINLLENESDTFYTRLNKIESEIDNISELNIKLSKGINESNSAKVKSVSLNDIINEILEVMNHEFLNTNIELNFIKSNEDYQINIPKGKFRSALINLLVYILNRAEEFKVLNIYYKKNSNGVNISFYLGVENYSFSTNITIESPEVVTIPKELEITKKLLNNINSKLEIIHIDELGYFFNILVK